MWNSGGVKKRRKRGTLPFRLIYGVHCCGSAGTDWKCSSWKPIRLSGLLIKEIIMMGEFIVFGRRENKLKNNKEFYLFFVNIFIIFLSCSNNNFMV